MPTNSIIVKHNKHRVHPCPNDKKLSLLNLLIAQNNNLKIVVVTAKSLDMLREAIVGDNVIVTDDKGLDKTDTCELLISYDLPSTGILYMDRLAKATREALILLDSNEQKDLYPIETLLKRAIKQEIVAGFEYEVKQEIKKEIKKEQKLFDKPKKDNNSSERKSYDKPKFDKPKYNKPKRDGEKSERKPYDKPKYDKPKRDGESSERKPYEKPKYDKPKRDAESSERKLYDKPKREGEKSSKFAKSDKKPNKFLGKDENGKAIFSGKSGDRNHRYDGSKKESYAAPAKVGRKISIESRKPKKESDSNS